MIYDCFIFFNEIELLEIRLNELDSVVDKFVIVEATKTHSGVSRELCFNENDERIKPFLNKIIYVPIDFPEDLDINYIKNYIHLEHVKLNPDAWLREIYQRNSILKGLKEANPNDIIMISDVDEIPDKKKIYKIKDENKNYAFEQNFYYYYLNVINVSEKWIGTKITFFKNLASPQDLRYSKDYELVKNGGWHFSYLGGIEKIRNKIDSFAHQEYNVDKINNVKNIEYNINNNLDILGRPIKYKVLQVDESFPNYIIKNKHKFEKFIKKEKVISDNTKWLMNQVFEHRKKIDKFNTQFSNLKSEKEILTRVNNELKSEKELLAKLVIEKFDIENKIQIETSKINHLNKDLNLIKASKFFKLWQGIIKLRKFLSE